MKRRYYFDTSVFGGVFDDEFKDYSIQLFDQVKRGRVICVYSDLVVKELQDAPKQVIDHLNAIPEMYKEKIAVDASAETLAKEYIEQDVVGKTSYNDCVHIALATMFGMDAIVSWNFKHIVNSRRIAGYNSVNLKFGYKEINIVSPRHLITYGRNEN